ncbi:MAG: DUF2344 domain-containing protein [Oscillospiraceae bacterium]|nr:DUF2344 domain-containing protein [Oscillospiraceae bacterium]
MQNVRIFFIKRDRAKYISHLDMTRLFQRAVRRSGITMWYTEGFHPHLYMTFALPLALGTESNCESVDMRLIDDISFNEVKDRLNAVLPVGIEVIEVSEPVMKASVISSSMYLVRLYGVADKKTAMDAFLAQDEIMAIKKGKAGEKLVNIKNFVYGYEVNADGSDLCLWLKLASGNQNTLNPQLLIGVFSQQHNVSVEGAFLLRTKVLCENGEEFK